MSETTTFQNFPVPVTSERGNMARKKITTLFLEQNLEPFSDVILKDDSESTIETLDGSRERKCDGMKTALAGYYANLSPNSESCFISFNDDARIQIPLSKIANKTNAIATIWNLPEPSGMTNFEKALALAKRELQKASHRLIRIFILSDGLPSDNPKSACDELKRRGCEITTIGFGLRGQVECLNESLLAELASIGPDGKPLYYHFSDTQKLTQFMVKKSTIIR